jgi:cytochrome P450
MVIPPTIMDHYAFVEDVVTKRLKEQRTREIEKVLIEREDMLHFLCSAKDPDTGKPAFGLRDLLAEANLLIVAGSDTTSITISSLFFYLTHDRRAYLKLVKEVRDVFTCLEDIVYGSKLLTDCKYLRACIDETLRLSPAGPIELPREVLPGGTTIGGEHYPAEFIVCIPHWAMGRNEEHYGDAYTFRPERWIVLSELESFNAEDDVRKLRRGLHTFLK